MSIKQQIKHILIDYVNGVLGALFFTPLILLTIAFFTLLARVSWWVIVSVWNWV